MLIFKLPFENNIYSIEELSNGSFPVEFFGFDNGTKISFEGELKPVQTLPLVNTEQLVSNNENPKQITEDKYEEKIKKIIQFIQDNNLQKLVFSRQKILDDFNEINLTESFKNLCESYPNAFVYLFQKENTCWMGAFSELLGKYNYKTQEFETMSLAGTLPIEEKWTLKEIEEQQPVTSYIETILKEYGTVKQSDTYDHISGKIKHLRTDFKIKVKAEQVESIIEQLHPTPAVCGIPKTLCKKAITDFENYDRGLYSGYSKIKMNNTVYYFVNLRCAKFFKNKALVFVGGGITRDSDAKKEWRETELKSQAILNHLVIS